MPGNPQSRVEVFDVASTDADVGFNARPDYAIVTVDNNDCSLEPCTGEYNYTHAASSITAL